MTLKRGFLLLKHQHLLNKRPNLDVSWLALLTNINLQPSVSCPPALNHIHKDIVSLCVLRSHSSEYFLHSTKSLSEKGLKIFYDLFQKCPPCQRVSGVLISVSRRGLKLIITQLVQCYVMDDWGRKLCQRMVQFWHWFWIGGGRMSSSLEQARKSSEDTHFTGYTMFEKVWAR